MKMNEVKKKKKEKWVLFSWLKQRGYFKIEHEEKINTWQWRVSKGVMIEYHRLKIWNETNET